MASSLTFDLTDGIARVTINRPDKLNALNAIVIAELGDAVTRIETDPAIRGVIVTGTGNKAFVAGADINELTEQGVTGGQKRALELLLTGDMIDAEAARQMGLVNRVVPADRLMAEAESLLRAILANGPLAIRACLEAVDMGSDMTLDQALLLEAGYFGLLSATEDMREGTKAFVEKRKPGFKGK